MRTDEELVQALKDFNQTGKMKSMAFFVEVDVARMLMLLAGGAIHCSEWREIVAQHKMLMGLREKHEQQQDAQE
jgi:hypothetical protein